MSIKQVLLPTYVEANDCLLFAQGCAEYSVFLLTGKYEFPKFNRKFIYNVTIIKKNFRQTTSRMSFSMQVIVMLQYKVIVVYIFVMVLDLRTLALASGMEPLDE